MTTSELFRGVFDTIVQHVRMPAGFESAPTVGLAVVAVLGVLMLMRGARWAPGLAAITLLAVGAAGGALLGAAIGTPIGPTAGAGGVLGCILALAMFRFWQAAMLGVCAAAIGVVAYAFRLTPAIGAWLERGLDDGLVTLRPAGAVVADSGSSWSEVQSLWNHLVASVPSFQLNMGLLLGAGALSGFLLGWFLPRFARALWAATLGVLLLGIGATGLLKLYAPGQLDWMLANDRVAWATVGGFWLVGLGYNLLTARKLAQKQAPAAVERVESKPAMA